MYKLNVSVVYLYRFRPQTTKNNKFFVTFGTGQEIINPTSDVDKLQTEYNLPNMCSSNARHVLETLKGTSGLDATASAGIINIIHNS